MKAIRFSSNHFAKVSSAIFPQGVNALCAIANENIFGKTFAPRCSNGILNDHSALFPPAIEGEADISKAWCSLNGCGRNLETQSMTFFITPGIEPLYSGDKIMKASFSRMRFRNSSAHFGYDLFASKSWLNDGQSNSFI